MRSRDVQSQVDSRGSFPFGNNPTFRPCSVSTSWQLVSVASAPAGNITSEKRGKNYLNAELSTSVSSGLVPPALPGETQYIHINYASSQGFLCRITHGAMETERKSVLYWQWGSACSVVCVCPCESCCWLVKKHLKHGFYQTCEKSFVSVSEKAAVGFWLSEERYFCHGVGFFWKWSRSSL